VDSGQWPVVSGQLFSVISGSMLSNPQLLTTNN
jgi:hypothetical protein